MAKNNNLTDFLTDVADAIRAKKGTTDKINPQDFASEIASIETSVVKVAAPFNDVNFRDYDGTILYSYSKDEFLALTELPPLPTKKGLICQEWNWTYDEAMEYVAEYGILEVGATYITDDGATRLYMQIDDEDYMTIPLYFRQRASHGVGVDWGDGSPIETFELSNGIINATHTYSQKGDYIIKLQYISGVKYALSPGQSYYTIFGDYRNSGVRRISQYLRKVECGYRLEGLMYTCFQFCGRLESVSIAHQDRLNVGTFLIDSGAFSTTAVRCIVFPRDMSVFKTYIAGDSTNMNLTSYVLPADLPQITTNNAIGDILQLTRFVIPSSQTKIMGQTFRYDYSLSRLIIPKTIQTIGSKAFFECNGLVYIDFTHHEQVPTLENIDAFTGTPAYCEIRVPKALEDEWKQATNWSEYASQIVGV